jgi:hypothetical protein
LSPNARTKLDEHLDFLIKFLEIHYKSLNYDAQQLHSLLLTFIKQETEKRKEVASNPIIQGWKKDIENEKVFRIERLHICEDTDDADNELNKYGYDFLINSNKDENFVISVSTNREEICVWNVLK